MRWYWKYHARERMKINARVRKRYAENPAYAQSRKDKQLKYRGREYYQRWLGPYRRKRRVENIQFAIGERLRGRVNSALRAAGARKSASTAKLVGCSIPEFKIHIERQFLKGMTWENRKKWHLDHIVELARFDLRDPEQQRRAFHFTNQRPLWGPDNLSKGAKRLYLL